MIRFSVADLVAVAAEALGVKPAEVLDLLDLEAADRALADPVPSTDDPAERAGALLHGLLHHRPISRGARRVAVLATAQFLALNDWQLDLEPPGELAALLRAEPDAATLATWLRMRMTSTSTRRRPRRGRRTVFGRMTDRGRRVVVLAQEEARLHRHNYLGTEHLLLGLLHEGEEVAARALRSLGVDLDTVRDRVEQIIGEGRDVPRGKIPLTPRAKRALELARDEADRLGQPTVATEHILLGVIAEGGGIGAQILLELGLTPDRVRERIHELPTQGEPSVATQLDELRRATDTAIDAGDFATAAALRAWQRELLGDEPDAKIARLEREVERLRARLRAAGIDPDEGTARTA
jgi:hypothetical protein